ADPARVERLETALLDAPRHTTAERVRLGRSETQRHGWTHVWEQDYADPAALEAYMNAAHHWTVLDPFFDATNPDAVVDRVTVAAYESESAASGGDAREDGGSGLRRILLTRVADEHGSAGVDAVSAAIRTAAPRLPLRG